MRESVQCVRRRPWTDERAKVFAALAAAFGQMKTRGLFGAFTAFAAALGQMNARGLFDALAALAVTLG